MVVVGIGPDARKPKNRKVLEYIGGKNLFFVDDYARLDDATRDIKTLICRKLKLVIVTVFNFNNLVSGRDDDLKFSVLESESSGLSSSPDRGIELRFEARHLFSQCLSIQVYKWLPANITLAVTFRSVSVPVIRDPWVYSGSEVLMGPTGGPKALKSKTLGPLSSKVVTFISRNTLIWYLSTPRGFYISYVRCQGNLPSAWVCELVCCGLAAYLIGF